MIGSLRGRVLRIDGMTALIEVQGTGFEVEASARLLPSLKIDEEVFLFIHEIIREDANLLFGFADFEERALFRELIKVSGIGPKSALTIVSTMTVSEFLNAVSSKKTESLVSVPGIGQKTAQRLIVEMQDRLVKLKAVSSSDESSSKTLSEDPLVKDEAVSALMGLGYKEAAALKLVDGVYEAGMDTKAVIVAALAAISKAKKL